MLHAVSLSRRTTSLLKTVQQIGFVRGKEFFAENGTFQNRFALRENEICVDEHGGNDNRRGLGIEHFPRECHEFGIEIGWGEDGGKNIRLGHMSMSSVRK